MFQWIESDNNNSILTDNPSKLKIRDVESYKLAKKQAIKIKFMCDLLSEALFSDSDEEKKYVDDSDCD